MKCPECGFQLRGNETVCPRCLTPLSYAKDSQPAVDLAASQESALTPSLEPAEMPEAFAPKAQLAHVSRPKQRFPLIILTLALAAVTVVMFAILFLSVARKNARYYMEQAQTYYQNGQYENALNSYLRVLEKNAGSATAENGAGWCYLKMGRPSQAISHLRQAVELEPGLVKAHLGMGIAYNMVAMYPEAETSLKKSWEARDPEAGYYLGHVYYQEQRYDEAITILQKVTRERPQDVRAQEYLGRSLYAMERYDEALEPLRIAVRKNPDAASAREYLGLVSFALGRCDWALEQFQILQAAHPQNPAWYAYAGQCLYKEGKYEQAISHLNHALILSHADPILSNSHLYLGRAYYEQARYDQAIVLFQRALIMSPQNAEAMAGLGWCYAALERCQDAKPLFEQALLIDPYLKFAQEGLAACP